MAGCQRCFESNGKEEGKTQLEKGALMIHKLGGALLKPGIQNSDQDCQEVQKGKENKVRWSFVAPVVSD